MMITSKAWNRYVAILRRVSERANKEMRAYLRSQRLLVEAGEITEGQLEANVIDYAYALATRYGEAAGAAACDMYDAIAELQGASVPPAVPAATATYDETTKALLGAMKSGNEEIIASTAQRLVKQAGADTTLQNAERDNAWFAWVAHGDTCAYCLTLAGLGWQKAGELTLKGGHAEHIHANCDCEYAVDFKGTLRIEGFDPRDINQSILEMTGKEYDAIDIIRMSGHNAKGHDHEALNMIRRKFYADNKETINAQKRSAYAKRKERNSSAAEEIDVTS